MKPTRGQRWANVRAYALDAWLGLAAFLSLFVYLAPGERLSPTALVLGNWAVLFFGAYAVAGVLILAGLWSLSARLHFAGLSLIASALFIQAVAVFVLVGFGGAIALVSQFTLVVMLLVRMMQLLRGEILALLRPKDESDA